MMKKWERVMAEKDSFDAVLAVLPTFWQLSCEPVLRWGVRR